MRNTESHTMGYDIVAYFDIDQKDTRAFIECLGIKDDIEYDVNTYLKNKYMDIADHDALHPIFESNSTCKIYEWFDIYGVNFIRDNEYFYNKRLQRILEKEHDMPFPESLNHFLWKLDTSEYARVVAKDLELFFPDDHKLMRFAKWLRLTSKYNATYELST